MRTLFDPIPVRCRECGRDLLAVPHRSGGLRVRNHYIRSARGAMWCTGSQSYDHTPIETNP